VIPLKDKFTPGRLGDFVYFCQQCGTKCWASETVKLGTYTGHGGLRVCSECVDVIDYGIVPYKIPAEKPVPFAFDTTNIGNIGAIYQQYPSWDYEAYDWTVNPNTPVVNNQTWDQSNFTWNASIRIWGDGANPNPPGGLDIDEDGDAGQGGFNP
jgi:hypothetical protein